MKELKDQAETEYAMLAVSEERSVDSVRKCKELTRHTKRNFNILRSRFKATRSRGINSVLVPDTSNINNSTLKVINDPPEVEEIIIKQNIDHFGQSQGTPFTTGKILETCGYQGITQQATQIVEGQDMDDFIESLGPGEKSIMRTLNDGYNLPKINIELSLKSFMAGFRKWREATSTSPSGRHLGHYKALLKAELPDEVNEDGVRTHKKGPKNPLGSQIFEVLYHITLAALRSGETLDRWKIVHSSMLEKDVGKPLISRLRVIHIYEADYNLVLKLLWARQLTWHAHTRDQLHQSQAGSRPGRKAIDVVVFKEMKYLYSRLTRTALATMDNDAKACYDRIICNLAMMVSQYFGMPLNACKMQAQTLQNMEFHLRTAMGVSDNSYKHTINTPVHGSGQGSCASPALWLMISSILMRCHDKTCPGMSMNPIQKGEKELRSNIDGFVDDTSQFSNLPFHIDVFQELINTLYGGTQKWSELLQASGGKLNLSKCFFYILWWFFTPEGDPVPMKIEEQKKIGDPTIRILDQETGQYVTIQQRECDEEHRTLGVFKTLIGDDNYQYEVLLEKSNKLAIIVSASQMTRHQARLSYNMIYIPTIIYCFPACSFTEKQLDNIQMKALPHFLAKMGWLRTTARALIHGPIELGGVNIPHLYAIHCTVKILTLLNHVRAQSELGKLFIINLNWLQLLSGRKDHVLQKGLFVPYLQPNWFLQLQDFLEKCQLSIHSSLFWIPTTARCNDQILMDAAIHYTMNARQLRIINNWRVYFQAIRLSDICDGGGQMILAPYREYKEVSQHLKIRSSMLNWPKQGLPNKSSFQIWKKFLIGAFGMQKEGSIRIKLGHWYGSHVSRDTRWHAYVHPTEGQLYLPMDYYYTRHDQISNGRLKTVFKSQPSSAVIDLPRELVPTTIHNRNTSNVIATYHKSRIDSIEASCGTQPSSAKEGELLENDFEVFLRNRASWETDLCSFWKSEDHDEFQTALNSQGRTLVVATDGKSIEGTGRYAFVLSINNLIIFKNTGKLRDPCPRAIPIIRIKLIGVLSSLVSIRMLLEHTGYIGTQDRNLEIHSNHQGLVNLLNTYHFNGIKIGANFNPHMDVVAQIQSEWLNLIQSHQIEVIILYTTKVKHKNRKKSVNEEPTISQRLMEKSEELVCDNRIANHMVPHETSYNYPASVINIKYKNNFLHQQVYKQIISSYSSYDMKQYIMRKNGWNIHILDTIWWEVHEKALLRFSPQSRQIIQKYNFDLLATNTREAKIYGYRSSLCEVCGIKEETCDHVLQCTGTLRQKCRGEFQKEIDQFLDDPDTPEGVRKCMKAGIRSWLEKSEPPAFQIIEPSGSRLLQKAYEEQTVLGWNKVGRGYLSIKWKYLIHISQKDRSEEKKGKRKTKYRTPETWCTGLIQLMWTNIIKNWENRNEVVHALYIKQGKTREMELLAQVAEQETLDSKNLPYGDRQWLEKTPEELRAMPLNSLKLWVQNIRGLKTWFKNSILKK